VEDITHAGKIKVNSGRTNYPVAYCLDHLKSSILSRDEKQLQRKISYSFTVCGIIHESKGNIS
jgi:hypothetical protein